MSNLSKNDRRYAADGGFAAHAERLRALLKRHVAETRNDLAPWLEQTPHAENPVVISSTLLEMALDTFLVMHDDPSDVLDVLQMAFERAVERRRQRLQ